MTNKFDTILGEYRQDDFTTLAFTELSDAPSSYSGQALKGIRVNSAATGLEFFTGSGLVDWGEIGGTLSDQTDLQTALNLKLDVADFTPTSPASPDTSIQYNNAGALGGAKLLYTEPDTTESRLDMKDATGDTDTTAFILKGSDGGTGNHQGGGLTFTSGQGAGSGTGGNFTASAGVGGATGDGGDFNFQAGQGGGTSGNGGVFNIAGGSADGSGNGGDVTISGGSPAGAGTAGNITFIQSDGLYRFADDDNDFSAILNAASIATSDKTFTFPDTTGTLGLKNQEIATQGAGTAYALTNTAAAINLGTTDPVITLNAAGTYLIFGQVQLEYTGATVATETATIKVRRTNNTAADLSSVVVLDLPVSTVLTNTYGIFQIPPFVYATTATDDSVTIFGNVSAALSAGTIDASALGTKLTAIRLY